ncbi:PREDICTED: uncharacterized protein LOC109126488 [Camelina sativa]|uniref:Uncharacterized protein LOC109126488 n=1 Tax=Camelina sativa TaxID=90675 RepID=A0ABM1QFT2_CAMSA|nr:PREDICTED: uncharacterized protein LOC109126488 [Camelina sativa]
MVCRSPLPLLSPPLSSPSLNGAASSIGSPFISVQRFPLSRRTRKQLQVVSMAPEEEKLTRRNPLDFQIVIRFPFRNWLYRFLGKVKVGYFLI